MKTAVYFLAVLGCAFAIPDIDWSKIKANNIYAEPLPSAPLYASGRIIGGSEVSPPNSRPHTVGLILNGVSFCSGFLISPEWVVTAAHCTISNPTVQVILGAHNINQAESSQQVVTTNTVVNHPAYDSSRFLNDIALVRLPNPVTLNQYIQPIALAPSSSGTFAGSIARLNGWGRPSDASGAISPTLQEINLPVLPNAQCASTYGTLIQDSHICTSGAGGIGACNGDSGGPLAVGDYAVGVVSFGTNPCSAGNPTAYARISSYRDWIAQQTGV